MWGVRRLPQKEPCLKVMTYNIRHGEGLDGKVSLDRILADLRTGQADIVALQEVDRNKLRSGYADQIKYLAEKLQMEWCFSPSLEKGISQYGNGILSRLPIAASKVHFLPGKLERRSALVAGIRVGTARVSVVNTHLGVSRVERENQLSIFLGILGQIQGPAILMGDFNMEMEEPLMCGITSNWSKLRLHPQTPTLIGGQEIDHIFVNFHAEGLSAWTLPVGASDHYPVLAQIPVNMIN